jgi:hypothetical protein
MAKTHHDDSTFAEVLFGEASSKRLTPALTGSGARSRWIKIGRSNSPNHENYASAPLSG